MSQVMRRDELVDVEDESGVKRGETKTSGENEKMGKEKVERVCVFTTMGTATPAFARQANITTTPR